MGTRGMIGFRFNGEDKLAYNQYDSYPTSMGASAVNAVRKFNDEQLAGTAKRLTVVDQASSPPADLAERYSGLTDSRVSTGTDWYATLRHVQGEIEPYVTGGVDHMTGNVSFLSASLFCEWAYIINMDDRTLEFYKGFNNDPDAPGRYAKCDPDSQGYVGVALIAKPTLADVRATWTDTGLFEFLTALEKNEEDEDD